MIINNGSEKSQYTQDDCKRDTLEHITHVQNFVNYSAEKLIQRGLVHDQSKLQSPELEIFTEYTPKLKTSTYGSDEYKEFLKGMKVGLDHHYANNSHHPEHYRKYVCNTCFSVYVDEVGACEECLSTSFTSELDISQMDLFDLIEMICDWKAAVMRHDNGDINRSLEINRDRFGMTPQLYNIIKKTIERF